jgi:hypothetical protein
MLLIHLGHWHLLIAFRVRAGRIVASVNAQHVPPDRCVAEDARQRALYDYCTIRVLYDSRKPRKTRVFQGLKLVELVGIEPTAHRCERLRLPTYLFSLLALSYRLRSITVQFGTGSP